MESKDCNTKVLWLNSNVKTHQSKFYCITYRNSHIKRRCTIISIVHELFDADTYFQMLRT